MIGDRYIERLVKVEIVKFSRSEKFTICLPRNMKNRPLISQCLGRPIDEIIDFVRAKDEGKIIVPPCKVGDVVYYANYTPYGGEIWELAITQVIYDTKGIAFDERAIGESIFLTKAKAEDAIAERSKR